MSVRLWAWLAFLVAVGGLVAFAARPRAPDWRTLEPDTITAKVRLGMAREEVLRAFRLPDHERLELGGHTHREDGCYVSLGQADFAAMFRPQSEYTLDFDPVGRLTGIHRNRVFLTEEDGEYVLGSP